MSFNAVFYTFSKRENSTAQPSGSGTTLSVELKDDSSVVEPILRLHNTANWNPSALNYCYISEFSRYYFVKDWEYALGEWNCYLQSDVLASFKTEIGNQEKYVLRSSYTYDAKIIDDYYPAKFQETEIAIEHDFGFDINNGDYVLGVVNRQETNVGGMVSFYRMPESNLNEMKRAMYPTASDYFEDISLITGDVIRSIIDPWQYIISCKRFPITIPSDAIQSNMFFGAWQSDPGGSDRIIGWRLSDSSLWGSLSHDFTISNDWLQRDVKETSNARIYVVCNPWGAVELSPSDFSSSSVIRVEILPDFISGYGILKIYSVKGPLSTLVAQRTAKIGVDTTIASTSIDTLGGLSFGLAALGKAVSGSDLAGALGFAVNAAKSMVPSLSNSTALQEGFRSLEGVARVIVRIPVFASEYNDEIGRPYMHSSILNAIPGYIKCADGEHTVSAYSDEKKSISVFMTEGFFYE